jgi:hypothetical protein
MREAKQIKQLEATGSHNSLTLELLPRAITQKKEREKSFRISAMVMNMA